VLPASRVCKKRRICSSLTLVVAMAAIRREAGDAERRGDLTICFDRHC
jgi:hypothetical protein